MELKWGRNIHYKFHPHEKDAYHLDFWFKSGVD